MLRNPGTWSRYYMQSIEQEEEYFHTQRTLTGESASSRDRSRPTIYTPVFPPSRNLFIHTDTLDVYTCVRCVSFCLILAPSHIWTFVFKNTRIWKDFPATYAKLNVTIGNKSSRWIWPREGFLKQRMDQEVNKKKKKKRAIYICDVIGTKALDSACLHQVVGCCSGGGGTWDL